jgi:hypothetical protein
MPNHDDGLFPTDETLRLVIQSIRPGTRWTDDEMDALVEEAKKMDLYRNLYALLEGGFADVAFKDGEVAYVRSGKRPTLAP